jgi:hypothetical protein
VKSGPGALPDPHAPITVVYWRCCAGCAAWLAYPYAPPQDERTYCGPCDTRREASCAGFDPRPHPSPDACVRRHSAPGFWVVLARDKDTLTLRRLGLPDAAPATVHLSDTYPRTDFRQSP